LISPLAIVETKNIGSNVTVMEYAIIRKDVEIGDDVIIHPFVIIEEGSTIGNGTEIFPGTYIGKKPKGAGATARPIVYEKKITIGSDCVLGPHAVIFYDVQVGDHTLIGDGASLREQVRVGHHCLISRYVTVNYDTRIGNHTRIMDMSHITGKCDIGDNVFISMSISTSNDNKVITREYIEEEIAGARIEDGATVGVGAILLPGVKIGTGAFVGAGAVVTRDVSPYDVVMGVPAKVVKNLREPSK
jgi:acetyltransferase-like isoleucine patch superfamily enzyme